MRWVFFIVPVWGFLALVFCAGNFPPHSHLLLDSDDYMRAVRVFDLLAGGADPYLQPRMGLEGGAQIMWSRLVDIPVAALVLLFGSFTGPEEALYWAATVLPLLQLAVLMVLACWAVAPLTGDRMAAVAVVILPCLLKIVMEFRAGRIDHHGWQVMTMLWAYGAMIRVYFRPQERLWAVQAGFALALGFAIGADIVLWAGLAAALGGLWWLAAPPDARDGLERANRDFGLSLFAFSAAFLFLLRPAPLLLVPACDGLSVTYVALAAGVCAFWSALRFLPPHWREEEMRVWCAAGLAAAILTAIVVLFPGCFRDPYGLADNLLYKIWQSQITEAWPAWTHILHYPVLGPLFLLPVLLGAWIALAAGRRFDRDNRSFWLPYAAVMIAGLAVSVFQIRLLTFAQILSLWPLCWGVAAVLGGPMRLRALGVAAAAYMVLVALLAAVNAQEKGKPPRYDYTYCPVSAIAGNLDGYGGGRSLTIATSYIFNGSELLFRTRHRVLAAPYHRDAAGMRALYDIFAAPPQVRSRELAKRYGVDLILICPGYWPFPPEEIPEGSLIRQLLETGESPDWLQRLPALEAGGFQVYQVE